MGFDDKSDGDVSKFNPAQLKMFRINDISVILNDTKLCLDRFNYLSNDWNFNIYFNSLCNLYKEVRPKLSESEKDFCDKFKNCIEDNMRKFPIVFKSKKNIGIINESRFNIFKKYMEDFEDYIRYFQDQHGLDTPNMEDDSGL